MASLGSLVISLAADTARFQGDLGRAASVAESRMRNIKDTATKALGALTIAATAAGAALVSMVKSSADRADSFTKLAQGAGVTVEQFSRLEYAAKLSGVSAEQLQKALAKLAASGVKDANAELLRLADRFSKMPDSAAKTSEAVKVFGERIGPQLIPLLNAGSAGIADLTAESDKLGNTISTETGKAAEQFNDNLTRLSTASKGFSNALTAELLPSLVGFTDYLVNAAKQGDSFKQLVGGISVFLKTLVTIADFGATTFVSLGRAIGGVFAAIASLFSGGGFSGAAQILRDLRKEADETSAGFSERFVSLWEGGAMEVASKAPQLGAALASPLTEAADVVSEKSFDISREIQALMGRITQKTSADVARDVKRNYDGTLYTLEVRAKETTETITEYTRRAAENMQDAFANFLFDPFQDGLKGMLRGFIDVIRRMVAEQAAANLFGSKSSGGFGLGDFVTKGVKSLFGFANGGSFRVGGSGGTDSQTVAFRATPGEMVDIRTPGQSRGGVTISPVYNIDARGATTDLVKALPGILRQNNEALKAEMAGLIRGGAFA
jgi:hypothetical protein